MEIRHYFYPWGDRLEPVDGENGLSYPKIVVTPPGPKAMKVVARDEQYISPSFGRAYPLVVKEAKAA